MPASGKDEITDDYVTELLRRDAKAASASASTRSLASLLNKRPQSSAPKPNTRFLRNILRDTDNHNAALLAKEAQEAKDRLNKLRQSQKPAQQLYSARDRHDPKRRRVDPAESDPSSSRSHRRRLSTSPPPRHRRHHDSDYRSGRRSRSPDRRSSRSNHRRQRSSHSRHDDSHKRRRHHSSSPDSHVTSTKTSKYTHDTGRRSRRSPSPLSDASDSDPLDAIIGPKPPPPNPPLRSRGRGATNKTSAIDDHFASNYDPSADVQPDSGQGDDLDWDQALEALRDRQRWKQQGAERLRAAGFSERDVNKWEKGGERSEEDVVWRKKGEGREWDRGKIVDQDGIVDVKPEWGRLKNS